MHGLWEQSTCVFYSIFSRFGACQNKGKHIKGICQDVLVKRTNAYKHGNIRNHGNRFESIGNANAYRVQTVALQTRANSRRPSRF